MEIAEWLHSLGLGQYTRAFNDNAVDWKILPRLTSDDLREIGVAAVGHRRRLLEERQRELPVPLEQVTRSPLGLRAAQGLDDVAVEDPVALVATVLVDDPTLDRVRAIVGVRALRGVAVARRVAVRSFRSRTGLYCARERSSANLERGSAESSGQCGLTTVVGCESD